MHEKLISNNALPANITTANNLLLRPVSNSIVNLLKSNQKFFSVELCPGKEYDLDLLKKLQPKFCSVTWHSANYANDEVKDIAAISLAQNLRYHGFDVMLHLAGRHLKRDRALSILERIKEIGVKDLLVLQGDECQNLEKGDFDYSSDLIKFIKENFANCFSLGVAAYPDQSEGEINYLVEKISLGASYIVTNGSLNTASYQRFLYHCRQHKIEILIIPGVFIISSYNMLHHISKLCRVSIPPNIQSVAEKNKDNENFKEIGIIWTRKIIKYIFDKKLFDCVHIFSLNNMELLKEVLDDCELISTIR